MSAATLTARTDEAVLSVTVARPNRATVAQLRAWLTGYLACRGHDRDSAENAVLILSELATNAITHALPPLTISARLRGDTLTLTVTDRINPEPRSHETGDPYESDEHGRGLRIVNALARTVTETTSGDRHTVTAAIRLGDPDIPGYLTEPVPSYPAI